MKICKDGRIWGQSNMEAGNHLGILKTKQYIKKGYNKNSAHPKGKHLSEEHKIKIGITKNGKKLSEETKIKIGLARKDKIKEKSPNWKGGITPIHKKIKNSLKYCYWRQSIFLRDDFTCQDCGQRGGNLEAHHCKKSFAELLQEVKQNLPLIDLYEAVMIYTPFWDLENGITLCKRCHKKTKSYGRG